jgi:hypothetical protein
MPFWQVQKANHYQKTCEGWTLIFYTPEKGGLPLHGLMRKKKNIIKRINLYNIAHICTL